MATLGCAAAASEAAAAATAIRSLNLRMDISISARVFRDETLWPATPRPRTSTSDGRLEIFFERAAIFFAHVRRTAKKQRHPAAGGHGVSRGPMHARRRTSDASDHRPV